MSDPKPERSAEGLAAGQQAYAVIEFCTDPETLWGKIDSGHWDWLGVKRTGGRTSYVVGRPPRPKGMQFRAYGEVRLQGEPEPVDAYRVEVRTPGEKGHAWRYGSADFARMRYREMVEGMSKEDGSSGMFRVRLIVDDAVEDEQTIVRTVPNVL